MGPQEKPQAGGDGAGLVVVGDDDRSLPDPGPAHHALDLFRRRPRMPPQRESTPSTWSRQVGVDVQKDRAGNVSGGIRIAAAPSRVEVPAHVDDPQAGISQPVRKPVRGDQTRHRLFTYTPSGGSS